MPMVALSLEVADFQEDSQSVLSAVFAAVDRFRDEPQTKADEWCKLLQAITALLADASSMFPFDCAIAVIQAAL